MSDSDIKFFKNLKFNHTNTRVPMALEVDVVDFDNLFGLIGEGDFNVLNGKDSIPSSAKLRADVSAFDDVKQLSAIIMRPDQLEADQLYEIVFRPKGSVSPGRTGKLRMTWQLSNNYKWTTAMMNGRSTKCDLMYIVDKLSGSVFLGIDDDGYRLIDQSYGSSIPEAALNGWYYFTVRGDSTDSYNFTTGVGKIEDITCWDDDQNPEHNDDGLNYCNGRGGNKLFSAPLGEPYYFDASNSGGNGNGNNQDPPPDEEIINPGIPRNNGDPDMKISTVNLSKGANSTRYQELEQDPEEKFYAYAQIKNVGTGRAKDFKVKFYIDGGKKNFNRDDEDYQGSVRIEEFNSGAEIRYSRELTSPTEPGTYWVYACITSIDEDSDMGNNCSDEDDKEEYGKLIIVEPPPVPSDLIAHSLRLKNGETTLPGGRSFGFTVTVNNIGAGDAESNFQILYEKNGPSTGYVWKPLGESRFSAVPLYAGSSEEHSTFNELAAAPTEEGDYRFRSCVDSKNVISESNEGNNCSGELEIEVLPSLNPSLKPVYRFWSDQNQSHFYTISETEKNNVINDYTDYQWRYERIAWCAYSKLEDDSLPVYRFWSDTNQSHFYTISETEKNKVVNDYPDEVWKYERIEWYAFDYAKSGTIPVYRFWSDQNQSHFYTASESEKQYVEDHYPDDVWKYEHVGWWVYPCP